MARKPGAAALGGSWDSLNPPLTPWIRDVVADLGHTSMTPVQAGTIPRAMRNQDCVVEAVTGSGKTLAFTIPVLERLTRREEPLAKGHIAAIVIAPTRELASQINDVFHRFLASLIPPPPAEDAMDDDAPSSSKQTIDSDPPPALHPLPMLVTSGTPTLYETFTAQSPSILVGTPGRLASFLLSPRGQSLVRVSELDALVLDEADRLLGSPDHRRDVERIMRHLPKQRRTHLFSATMTDAVEELVGLGLRNPVRIVVNLKDKRNGAEAQERRVPTALQNTFLVCRQAEKTVQTIRLLQYESREHQAAKFIIYFSTCAAVDYFYRVWSQLPELSAFHLTSLHGDLPPRVRETALSTFTSHPSSHASPAVLLCTDVAARGVDFADMDVVIQYDAPLDPKTFSHRAGRTARAGRRGKAIVLLCQGREEEYIAFLAVRKIPLERQSNLSADLTPQESLSTLDPAVSQLLGAMRAIALTDRELYDKGARALVSSVRAYTKHEATFIFRPADIDYAGLAAAFGLLRMPAMPEIKEWRKRIAKQQGQSDLAQAVVPSSAPDDGGTVDESQNAAQALEWVDADINWDTYAYLSKPRETARLAALAEQQAKAAARAAAGATGQGSEDEARATERKKRKIQATINEAWSEKKERKARREDRREKRGRRDQALHEARMAAGDLGMVEAFKAKQAERHGAATAAKKTKKAGDGSESESGEEMDGEWRALRKEVRSEKEGRKRVESVKVGSMFDGMD